jgi:hypothetical protein
MPNSNEIITTFDYDYKEIQKFPDRMDKWNLKLHRYDPTQYGKYSLVDVTPAHIEMHHQVEVIDEGGDPLRGVWVMFGFHTGYDYGHLMYDVSEWNAYSVLRGNMVKTNAMGYAQHTYKDGGEDIFIWDIDDQKHQKLSSDVVSHCIWLSSSNHNSIDVPFLHTGVRLVFQRRVVGIPVKSQRQQIKELQDELNTLKQTWSNERLKELQLRINEREQTLENLQLRIKNLELEWELEKKNK